MDGFDQITPNTTIGETEGTTQKSTTSGTHQQSIRSHHGLYQFHPEPPHIQRSMLTNNPMSGIMTHHFLRLLYHKRKSIDWFRYKHRILALFLMSLFNSFLAFIEMIYMAYLYIYFHYIPDFGLTQEQIDIKKLVRVALEGTNSNENSLPLSPIFVLGHPRTGTTMLHSLLALDEERFSICDTFMAGFPHCFLWFEKAGKFLFKNILTETRPMDNMKLHFDLPQEDELAINSLSGYMVSPYNSLVFMRDEVEYRKYQCFLENDVASGDVQTWTNSFFRLLRKIQLRDVLKRYKHSSRHPTVSTTAQLHTRRQVLLKSPCHTGRVRLFLKLFPDAKFIFIHRNPYEVFLSGCHLASTTYGWQFLQQPSDECLQEYILSQGSILHNEYFQCREDGILNKTNCCEVSFEELTKTPVECIQKLYGQFGYDSFRHDSNSNYPLRLEKECKELQGYQRNKFKHISLDQKLIETIGYRWQRQFDELGYSYQYDISL